MLKLMMEMNFAPVSDCYSNHICSCVCFWKNCTLYRHFNVVTLKLAVHIDDHINFPESEVLTPHLPAGNGMMEDVDSGVMSVGVSTSDIQTNDERKQNSNNFVCLDDPTMEAEPDEGGGAAQGPTEGEEGYDSVSPAIEDDENWGVLRKPVTVKIADLGNACWVVSCTAINGPLLITYLFIL